MLRILCALVILGYVMGEKPEVGSAHCDAVLATDCSGYSYEPVCAFDGKTHVTYDNSCEFAHGICTHNGHSLHAIHDGPCDPTSTMAP